MTELRETVALVTGAAGGIGRAAVDVLTARGAAVAAVDVDATAVEDLAAASREWGRTVLAIPADVRDAAAVEAAVDTAERELGPLDVAVSVAGILRHGPIEQATDDDWRAVFAVNARGPFHLLRAAGRRMRPREHGAIVVVGSNAASVPRAELAAYAASKAAATMLARCAGLELARHGIRVNVVSPGSTDTGMQTELWPDGSAARRAIEGSPEHFRVGIPLGRMATPADVAEAVAFLASPRARHITMQDLLVDGGAALAS